MVNAFKRDTNLQHHENRLKRLVYLFTGVLVCGLVGLIMSAEKGPRMFNTDTLSKKKKKKLSV